MRIKKNDQVQMISGKDRGKRGKVIKVFPDKNKVIIEGLNLVKRHRRPRRSGEKGQRVEVPTAVPVCRVMLVCPSCGKPCRVKYQFSGDAKFRVCSRCKSPIKN